MSSWWPQWLSGATLLPNLPNIGITLPSNIQARVLSFVLRRTLGRFVKPGQLEADRINAQVGSGYVQINDLALDHDAVNALLAGLPLRLDRGSIGLTTLRVPWPNPMTSTLGLSVGHVHLEVEITDHPLATTSTTLEESVASLTESFVHDEIYHEGPSQYMHSAEVDDHDTIPGMFTTSSALPQEQATQVDMDENTLVSVMIERFLARFTLDVTDITVSLTRSKIARLSLQVESVRFGSETTGGEAVSETTAIESRNLTINGARIYLLTLRESKPLQEYTKPLSTGSMASELTSPQSLQDVHHTSPPRSASVASSTSEDEMRSMSQSQFLPPPHLSASYVSTSSLYESALMEPVQRNNGTVTVPCEASAQLEGDPVSEAQSTRSGAEIFLGPAGVELDNAGDLILALTESLAFSFARSSIPSPSRDITDHGDPTTHTKSSRISITTGAVPVLLRSRNVRDLAEIALLLFSSHDTPHGSGTNSESTAPAASRNAPSIDVRMKGLVVLLLPSDVPDGGPAKLNHIQFMRNPFQPPSFGPCFVRAFVDGIHVTIRTSKPGVSDVPGVSELESVASMQVTDISVFLHVNTDPSAPYALPILILDSLLPDQYKAEEEVPPLPTSGSVLSSRSMASFDIIDWTDPTKRISTAKLSHWRVRSTVASHHRPHSALANVGLSTSPPNVRPPVSAYFKDQFGNAAFNAKYKIHKSQTRRGTVTSNHGTVNIAAIHLFVDLSMLEETGDNSFRGDSRLLTFLDECMGPFSQGKDDVLLVNPKSNQGAQRHHVAFEKEVGQSEQGRLRQQLLADLDLEYHYGHNAPRDAWDRAEEDSSRSHSSIHVDTPMLRIHMRCPPPPGKQPRSGAFIVDLHDIAFQTRPISSVFTRKEVSEPDSHTTIGNDNSQDQEASQASMLISVSKIYVLGCPVGSRKATAVGYMTKTSGTDSVPSDGLSTRHLMVKIHAPNVPSTTQTRTVITVDVPAIFTSMSKAHIDCLQLFADDLTQLFARLNSPPEPEAPVSQEGSIIGSRFFAKYGSRSGSIAESEPQGTQLDSETVVKIRMMQVHLSTLLPRSQSSGSELTRRPLDLHVVQVDALIELKPDGRDETVVTASINDLEVLDTEEPIKFATTPLLGRMNAMSGNAPLIKLRFTSRMISGTLAKESLLRTTVANVLCSATADMSLLDDLRSFLKPPPGAFEDVVPSERMRISVKIHDSAARFMGEVTPVSSLIYIDEMNIATDITDHPIASELQLNISHIEILLSEDHKNINSSKPPSHEQAIGSTQWQTRGYSRIAEIADLRILLQQMHPTDDVADTCILLEQGDVKVHLCADTGRVITLIASELSKSQNAHADSVKEDSDLKPPTMTVTNIIPHDGVLESLDELNFKRLIPEVGPTPDFIEDDLPSNPEYIDDSYGTAGGLRALDESDSFEDEEFPISSTADRISTEGVDVLAGGETIRLLTTEPLRIEEHHFDMIPPEINQLDVVLGKTDTRVRVRDCNLTLFLHDGYDWASTRKFIEDETKAMRKKLMKIRQLLADGQTPDLHAPETSALLFNSVYVGVSDDVDSMDANALIAAIEHELDDEFEISSQSSWQTLVPMTSPRPSEVKSTTTPKRSLRRSKQPSIEFRLAGLSVSYDQYRETEPFASRVLCTIRDLQILDHIKTSTWKMFLTEMRRDLRGIVRETDSDMVRIELRNVRPIAGSHVEESRLRAKLLPLRLHVDQDALDFMKRFFSFQDPQVVPITSEESSPKNDAYFQHVEVFPVDIKLDYKPRRVDYRALKEGRTIELMNFFHFDGSEMTLRHIRLQGVSGWATLGDLLNDLWTPDVKATQLVDVISGVAPIRSVVNVGSGMADLVLLPIAQYKKDGRIVRGMQKGGKAFMKSTGMEALKLGARLATGTQVILEQAEGLLGAQFPDRLTTEAVQAEPFELDEDQEAALEDALSEEHEQYSRYSDQPINAREGIESAYKTLKQNLNTAAQTILAVPMEVYERSGTEGPVRAVVRAVPIAVLKPMIGASEALRQTLLGIHNTFDSDLQLDTEAKYKQR